MTLTEAQLFDLIDVTWPAASTGMAGPFRIREGRGGGSRVSAATAEGAFDDIDFSHAEEAMRKLGQTPLFMVRGGEYALDRALAAQGYLVKDPVIGFVSKVEPLMAALPPPVTTFEIWPPLPIEAELWEAGGIGPARLDVMLRAECDRTTILGRLDDTPAGVAYVGRVGAHGMIHAIEVAPHFRRRGLGGHMIAAAARWVRQTGGTHLSLIVTRANAGAQALYSSLGMTPVGQYHYRIHPEGT